uniref:Vitellogenin domain-containing protein n=1 Tax=Tetranychus urticae TaxID=32264 RepID=T1L0I0_TETUR
MLLELSFIFIMIASTTTAQVTELLDLPLMMSGGELVIHANLYASSGKEKYSIKELVSASESAITGKIVVSNDKDSYDIHYQFDRSGKDSKERLVIHGNDCTLYTHSKMTQNANLFGTNKPLRDLILLMGPSIIYRLAGQSTVWSEATQKEIRGFNMNVRICDEFKKSPVLILVHEPDKYDTSYGVKHPTRIEFNGYEPSSYPPGEKLFLDIYLQQFNSAQFDASKYKVQPSPGIGCPHYLPERKTMPVLVTKFIRFTMYEEIQGSTNTRTYSEVTASGKNLLMRLKTSLLGVETEVIYDNGLGIILTLEKGGHCQMKIGDRTPLESMRKDTSS